MDTLISNSLASPRHHLPMAEDFLLWPPALQVFGYRIVDQLFASRTIHAGNAPIPLLRGPEISPEYTYRDTRHDTHAFMDRNRIAGLLILKDGKIRMERYGLGLQENERWSTMSTVKSMTAILTGAAVQDGLMRLDDAAAHYLPALRGSAYDDVSIRHLLTMSSGVRWNEDYGDRHSDVNRYSKLLADRIPGGVLNHMRTLERIHPPGEHWNYNTGDTFVLGAALTAAVGTSLADYMSQKIWQPCGMEYNAFYTLESEDGQEIGGSRAGMALRDFGRFAEFVRNDGIANGQRVLPEGWVDAAGDRAFHFSEEYLQQTPRWQSSRLNGYGYSWWIDQDGAMIAHGFAGQRIYIHHEERLCMVTLAAFPQAAYTGPAEHDHYAEMTAWTDAVIAAF